jgi:peptidoglycan/xylan/chitin deacetylase (PgdA/CDA1 family)
MGTERMRLTLKEITRDILILSNDLFLRFFAPRHGKRVIAFHNVQDPEQFRERIQWLQESYDIVSLGELMEKPLGQKTMVALTFDDGYRCWHDPVAPILEALKVPATFFVCSGFIGLKGAEATLFCHERLRRKQNLPPLSIEQLKDISNHPYFEIGSHTSQHTDLGNVSDEITFAKEISDDQKKLEEWTGKPVCWFSYPFGGSANLSNVSRNYLAKSSFDAAFTLIPRFYDVKVDKFAIGRDSLNTDDSIWIWRAWLNGAYDSFYALKESMVLKRSFEGQGLRFME